MNRDTCLTNRILCAGESNNVRIQIKINNLPPVIYREQVAA
jgi:hypothetical protein